MKLCTNQAQLANFSVKINLSNKFQLEITRCSSLASNAVVDFPIDVSPDVIRSPPFGLMSDKARHSTCLSSSAR
ncbi:hypothetical protein BLOT_007548 [Blomia tropicalis]|nr:hypothetical protein BLOT_007548 [Blomia tropicalis]